MRGTVATVDCGTTRVKAAVVDAGGRFLGESSRPERLTFSPDGGIEQDADRTARLALACLRDAREASGVPAERIAAISVTGQRATAVCVDRAGDPLAPAINWQDVRAAPAMDGLRRRLGDGPYARITGLPIHPVFTVGKVLWWRRHAPGLLRRCAQVLVLCSHVLRRFGSDGPLCDWSHASLTGLFDTGRLDWSDDVLRAAGLRRSQLPRLVAPAAPAGALSREAARASGLRAGTPLVAGGGDQQCSGLGAGAIRPGVLVVTLGTAAVPLLACGRFRPDPLRRVTCVAHAAPGLWEREGLQNGAGSSLTWLAAVLGRPRGLPPDLFREAARLPPGAGGALFLPYLTGASSPHWDATARGAFLGLRSSHTAAHLVRAVLEGVAFETREIADVLSAGGAPVREVRLAGGLAALPGWAGIFADTLGRPVRTLAQPQTTLMGGAALAAAGAGLHPSVRAASEAMVLVRGGREPRPAAVAVYADRQAAFRRAGAAIRAPAVGSV